MLGLTKRAIDGAIWIEDKVIYGISEQPGSFMSETIQ